MKARTLPQFIAIDGEGRNVAGVGSEHVYTLLANSTGNTAENTAYGLGTWRCFDYLCALKMDNKNAVFVGFALNYDINMILRDLPKPLLVQLWQEGRCYWHDDMLSRDYQIQYVPSKWFDLTWYQREGGQNQTIEHIRIWDTWGFFQCSFVKALRQWMPESESVIQLIEEMKEQRGEFRPTMQTEIRMYCVEECRQLVNMMDKLAAALWDAGLPLAQWHGAGAIAGKMLRQNKVKEHLAWEIWPEEIKDACLWAYFGGRVEIFQQGIIPGPIYDYDIQSAYPDRIALLPSLIDAEWQLYDGADFHDILIEDGRLLSHALVHVTWDTRGHRDAWLSPLPQHFAGGAVAWEPVGEGWYHIEEWREAKLIFGDCITELDSAVLMMRQTKGTHYGTVRRYAHTPAPFSFVHAMYERKAAYKRDGDPRYYPLKIGLNALYGKLAQSMTRNKNWGQPPYQNYYLAGKVTAGVRARMLRALYQCGQQNAVMAATDGLFCRRRMPRLRLGEHIGNWELQMAPNGMTLVQAGVFWEPGDERARRRTRGFGVKSVSYAEASALFAPPFADHTYKETRFVGMGYCVATGDWTNWRRWIEVRRKLSADLAPYHLTTGYRQIDHGVLDPQSHAFVTYGVLHDPAKRRPYLTRAERMQTPDEEQLDAIVASEQPQGAGGS